MNSRKVCIAIYIFIKPAFLLWV